ncbi:MAG: hypothetical protein AAFP04_00570 [Myxococcota bacterium]
MSRPPSPPDQRLDHLERENAQLREELARFRSNQERASGRRKAALKAGGRFLLPLMDRKRVVRNFVTLVEVSTEYVGPKSQWPERELVVSAAKDFALSLLRFTIRRRMLVVLFSLIAFTVPAMQVYVMIQQNDIIENQNKYFNVQVYDIVGRALSDGDLPTKQITRALLARNDFDLINDMVSEVLSENTDTFAGLSTNERRDLLIQETGARAYLIGALGDAINVHGYRLGLDKTWEKLRPSLAAVARDGGFRVTRLLRDFDSDSAGTVARVDSRRYLFEFGIFLRQVWSVAVAAGETEEFYERIAPAIANISRIRDVRGNRLGATLSTSFQELLLDIGMMRNFGAPPVDVDSNEIESLVAKGFERLKEGVGDTARVNWEQLRVGVVP